MKKIGIIGSDKKRTTALRKDLIELGYGVLPAANKAREADDLLAHQKPDLILFDISITHPEKLAGILQRVRAGIAVPFIFIAASDNANSLELARTTLPSAMLIGIVNPQTLYATIELAFQRAQAGLVPGSQGDPDPGQEPMLRLSGDKQNIPFATIRYIYASHVYMVIVTPDNETLHRISMSALMAQLPAALFCRVHRSCIINLKHITSVSKKSVMIGTTEISIGKTFRAELFRRLGAE